MKQKDNFALKGIVAGFTKSGTTLVNAVLNKHPEICNGFETGLLYEDNLIDFLKKDSREKIHHFNILKTGWELTDGDIEYICSSEDWFEAYERLRERSPLVKNKNSLIIDKTPRYLLKLSKVLKKIPNIPCVLMVRDPRAVICSNLLGVEKHSKKLNRKQIAQSILELCQYYNLNRTKYLEAIKNGYANRILVVQHEKLCLEPEKYFKKIFDFLKLDFSNSYLNLEKLRFGQINVHGLIVENKYNKEYKKYFNDEICQFIIKNVKNCDEWIF